MPPNLAPLLLLSSLSLACGAGCAASSGDEAESTESPEAMTATLSRSICFSGRSFEEDPYSAGGAADLADLCSGLPHLVRDVAGGRDAAYPFFRWNSDLHHAVDVLVGVLDTNHDGKVTNTDAPVELNVVGYSWGGYNARDVVLLIGEDARFSPSRKIIPRLITLDPYRTDALILRKAGFDIPSNVKTFYEFRHTIAPADDCSHVVKFLIGPFTGRDPRCTGTTVCHDYDYSQSPGTMDVDHCEVPSRAHDAVDAIIAGKTPDAPAPELAVPRY